MSVPPFFPQMSLTIDIWTHTSGPPNPPRLTVPCQLYVAKPYSLKLLDWSFQQAAGWVRFLFVPAHTDIRGPNTGYQGDVAEIVERRGLLYNVRDVDDRWLGFPNQYRMALLIANPDPTWPLP